MKLKSGAFVCATMVALFASVGYGAWQAKQKSSDQTASSDENPPSHDVTTPETPEVSDWPASWPAPLAKPSGTPEQVATVLAQKVLAGGPDALPALERAALESGFSIHNCETNAILFSPTPEADNGLSMADFDLFIAAEGAKRHSQTGYGGLQEDLKEDIPDFLLAYFLPQETMEGVYSQKSAYQFFGHFILQLGMQSKGEYDAIGQDDKTKLSEPQLCFLLYMAAGQAWAGSEGGDQNAEQSPTATPEVPPAENPPSDVPPASDPPPHGPSVHPQAQALDAAFRDLRATLTNLSNTNISEYIVKYGKKGVNPQSTLLGLARDRILRVGTKIKLRIEHAPLVRNKFFGQTGGTRRVFVRVDFSVPDNVRKKYDALRRFARKSKNLPDNGPQDVNVELNPEDSHVFTVKPDNVRTKGDWAKSDLIGAPQKQHLPTYPLVNDYETELEAYVPDLVHQKAARYVSVPIRDWLPTGVILTVDIWVQGSGQQDYGDQHLYWVIDRAYEDRALLDSTMPLPMISTSQAAAGSSRFTSWTQFPNATMTKPDPDPIYKVDDLYVWEGPVMDCNSKAGARGRSVQTVRSLPYAGDQLQGSPSIVEWDDKDKKYNFKRWYRPIPVQVTRDGSPDQQKNMSILDDIDIKVPTANGITLDGEQLAVTDAKTTGALQPRVLQVKSLKDGKGKSTVTVRVEWEIDRPGAKANGPGGGGGGKKPPQLTLAEQKALQTKVQEMLAKVLPKRDASSSIMYRPEFKPTIATMARAAHGPLWVSDPSAATCSETEVSDEFPLSVKASH